MKQELSKKLQPGDGDEPEEKGDDSHQYANEGSSHSFV